MMSDILPVLMPGVFKGVVPWYGAFLRNMMDDNKLPGHSLLSLHGLKDELIPAKGGLDPIDHYDYIPQAEQAARWAAANGCAKRATTATTPFQKQSVDTKNEHSCIEHAGCSTGAVVMYCTFPEQPHGFWPSFAEELAWWFMNTK